MPLSKKKFKHFTAAVFVSLLSLGIMLAVFEFVFRVFVPPAPGIIVKNLDNGRSQYPPVPQDLNYVAHEFKYFTETGFRLKRNARGLIKGHYMSGKDVEIVTNSLGFRHTELGRKRKGDYRVLVLGDSITWGDYLPIDETFPYFIEKYLQSYVQVTPEINRVDVINAGVGGIDLQNEFAVLMESGLKAEPDVVLIALYLNDAHTSPFLKVARLPGLLRKSYFLRFVFERIGRLRKTYAYYRWKKSTEETIAQEREMFAASHKINNTGKIDTEEEFNAYIYDKFDDWGYAFSEGYWQKILPLMQMFKDVARDNKFKLAVVLLPVAHQVHAQVLMDAPQRRFEIEMKKLNIPHKDLLPVLRDRYQKDQINLYYDHCHYKPEGNELIGTAIGEFLINSVL